MKRFFGEIANGSLTKKIIEQELMFNAHNYAPLPIVINRAEGSYVWDVEGKRYLDAISAFGAMNQGHIHPRIKNALISQLNRVTLLGRGLYSDKLGEASEFLTKTFGYDRSIMMNTGVEGGETAIKFARRWGYESKGIHEDKVDILLASNNFWGRTITACGSSDDPDRYTHFGPYAPGFKLLPYNDAEAFENELISNPNVAAIMLEPIQGEAGIIVPNSDFFPKIRKLCDKHNVLLIVDEVQTGLGRTGKLLCQEHYGVKADMVILGKALSGGFMPISAVLGSEKCFDTIKPGSHGSTYGGNPLACATAIESVKVVIEEKLIDNAKSMGDLLKKRLRDEFKENPYINDIRGKGLFIGFDIDDQFGPSVSQFIDKACSLGLLIKNTKPTKIKIAPSLLIGEYEVDFIVNTIKKAALNN